jgi:GGDEF domain-containing protein
VGALEIEISAARAAGEPLSLLLVELDEGARAPAAERAPGSSGAFGRFAQAVRAALRRQDVLAYESEARAWVIARNTSRSGGRALAARIAGAVRAVEPWRGAPLTVGIGMALLGEDGLDSVSLLEAAEEARALAVAERLGVRDRAAAEESEPAAPDPP